MNALRILLATMLVLAARPAAADEPAHGTAFAVTVNYETNGKFYRRAVLTLHADRLDVTWDGGATDSLELEALSNDHGSFTAKHSTAAPPAGVTMTWEGKITGDAIRGRYRVSDNKAMLTSHYTFAGRRKPGA
jgi:hypothetical protein